MSKPGPKPFDGRSEEQAEVIRKIRLLRRRHKDGSQLSWHAIAAQLNAENTPSPRGGRWSGNSVQNVAIRRPPPKRRASTVTRGLLAGDFLSETEILACRRAVGERDRLIFELYLCTGLRPKCEFCQLEVRDLGIWAGKQQVDVRCGKRKVARSVDIPWAMVVKLRAYLNRMGLKKRKRSPVFFCSPGHPLTYRALWERFKNLGIRAGLEHRLNPYRLRHTFGTLLYADTKDLNRVAKQMGHKKIETTQIYVHETETDKKEATNRFWQRLGGELNVRE
ncbi:MAG: tyrosine-type recombinase/integrase [Planctomycetota bacterium]|jgi:integrase